MADVNTVLADPKFIALPVPERLKVLRAIDPNFAALPLPEQGKAFLALSHMQPQPSTPAKPVEAKSIFEPITNAVSSLASGAQNLIEGGGKELGEHLANGIHAVTGIRPAEVPLGSTAPSNTMQSIGAGLENVAEFALGGAAIAPLKEAAIARTASPILKAAIGATAEGVNAAAVTAAQQGSVEHIAGPALTAGALGLAIPAALKVAGKVGMKIEHVLLKPSKADIEDGFDVRNVFKYRLGGTLDGTYEKTQKLITEQTAKARALRAENPTAVVDLRQALNAAALDLKNQAPRNMLLNEKIKNALLETDRAVELLIQNGDVAPNWTAPVDVAHEILQSVGQEGAWRYGAREPEAVAMEKVANSVYSQLKQSIENAIPRGSELRQVNKTIMDLIPIKQAILRRIPVEARNQVMHLSDIVALTKSIPLGLLNRTLRSGTTANILVKGSEKAGPLGDIGARLGGAAVAGGSQ